MLNDWGFQSQSLPKILTRSLGIQLFWSFDIWYRCYFMQFCHTLSSLLGSGVLFSSGLKFTGETNSDPTERTKLRNRPPCCSRINRRPQQLDMLTNANSVDALLPPIYSWNSRLKFTIEINSKATERAKLQDRLRTTIPLIYKSHTNCRSQQHRRVDKQWAAVLHSYRQFTWELIRLSDHTIDIQLFTKRF